MLGRLGSASVSAPCLMMAPAGLRMASARTLPFASMRASMANYPGNSRGKPQKKRTPYGSVLTAFGNVPWTPTTSVLRDVDDPNYRNVALNTIADNPGARKDVRQQHLRRCSCMKRLPAHSAIRPVPTPSPLS